MDLFTHTQQKIVKQDILEQCNPARDWKTIIFLFFILLAFCASGATYVFFRVLNDDGVNRQAINNTQLIKREALDATLAELTRRSEAFLNAPTKAVTVGDPSK